MTDHQTSASAFVKDGRLHIIGVANTIAGAVPFSYYAKVPSGIDNGPIAMNGDNNPVIAKAIIGSEGPIARKITDEQQRLAAESLVERARNGDQNATAMIVMVRRSAEKGAELAKRSLEAIKAYALGHPVTALDAAVGVNGERDEREKNDALSLLRRAGREKGAAYSAKLAAYIPAVEQNAHDSSLAAVLIASGPEVTPQVYSHIEKSFAKASHQAFLFGYKNALHTSKVFAKLSASPSDVAKALQVGYVLSLARRLQTARTPQGRIAVYSPEAAWELQETLERVSVGGEYYEPDGTRPPIPDSMRSQNIGQMGVVPDGYKLFTGGAPKAVREVCQALIFKPLGTESYQSIDGVDYFFRVEPHYHPQDYDKGPRGWHVGCTTYVAKVTAARMALAQQALTPETSMFRTTTQQ